MVSVMLFIQREGYNNGDPEPTGLRQFTYLPRIGETVTMDFNGKAKSFKVYDIHHPEGGGNPGLDIFAREIKES